MNKSTEFVFFFVKYDVLVFVPLHLFVLYRNISASLIVNCSRVFKVIVGGAAQW